MALFRLIYTETVRVCVEAPSESAAEQAWIDGDVDGGEVLSSTMLSLEKVAEGVVFQDGARS